MKFKNLFFVIFLFKFHSLFAEISLGVGFRESSQIQEIESVKQVAVDLDDVRRGLKEIESLTISQTKDEESSDFESLIEREEREIELLDEINKKLEEKSSDVSDDEFVNLKKASLKNFEPEYYEKSVLIDSKKLDLKNKETGELAGLNLSTHSLTPDLDVLIENDSLENKEAIINERERLRQTYISTLDSEISNLKDSLNPKKKKSDPEEKKSDPEEKKSDPEEKKSDPEVDFAKNYVAQARLLSLEIQRDLASQGRTLFTQDNFSLQSITGKTKESNLLLNFLIKEKQKEAKKKLNDLKLEEKLDLKKIINLEKVVHAGSKNSSNIEKKHSYLATMEKQKKDILAGQIASNSEDNSLKDNSLKDRLEKINLRIKQVVLSDFPQEWEYYKLKSELDQPPSPDAQAAFELVKNKKELEQNLILLDSYKKGFIELEPEKLSEIYSRSTELEKNISKQTDLFAKVMSLTSNKGNPILESYARSLVLEQNNQIWQRLSEDEKTQLVDSSKDILNNQDLMQKIMGKDYTNSSDQEKLNRLDQFKNPEKYFEKNLALNLVKQDFAKIKEILGSFDPLVTQVENENNLYPDRGNKVLRGLRRFKRVLVNGIKKTAEKILISTAVATETKNTIKQFLKAKTLNPKLIIATVRENVGEKITEIQSRNKSVSEIVRRLEGSAYKDSDLKKKAIGASSLILKDQSFKVNLDFDESVSGKNFEDLSNPEKEALKIFLGSDGFIRLEKGESIEDVLKEKAGVTNPNDKIIYSDDVLTSLKEIKNQNPVQQSNPEPSAPESLPRVGSERNALVLPATERLPRSESQDGVTKDPTPSAPPKKWNPVNDALGLRSEKNTSTTQTVGAQTEISINPQVDGVGALSDSSNQPLSKTSTGSGDLSNEELFGKADEEDWRKKRFDSFLVELKVDGSKELGEGQLFDPNTRSDDFEVEQHLRQMNRSLSESSGEQYEKRSGRKTNMNFETGTPGRITGPLGPGRRPISGGGRRPLGR